MSDTRDATPVASQGERVDPTRRGALASGLMGISLVAAYGTLGVQGLLFLLPERLRPRTRLLFAGQIADYPINGVRSVMDLEGRPVLVRRTTAGFTAFSSTCPHLGCKVHWQSEEGSFFCPCHRGVFDANGVGISGPPADAGQSLAEVAMKVDEEAGVVYLEVRDTSGRRA